MTTIAADTTLADLVLARPELARRLDELGLDSCGGGGRTLAEATDAAGLDLGATLSDLASVAVGERPVPTWSGRASPDPVDEGGEAPCWAHLLDGS